MGIMRILVIEDDASIQQLLKKGLEEHGFIVDVTSDGIEGSYIARTNDFDLILLDNMLPGKNGYDVCREIRSSGKTTPIIIVSIQAEIIRKIDLLESGADDYITKPFSFKELMARVKAILRRPQSIGSSVLEIDNLCLDCDRHKLMLGNKKVYLTRKEFQLLEFLLKHKGRVVSRAMILEHVWNMDTDPFSNTIEAHIRNLRKKIHAGRKKSLIHAIPGRGYKIDTQA